MQQKDLIRYIQKKTTTDESIKILNWIREDKDHQNLYNKLKAAHVASNLDNNISIDINKKYDQFVQSKNTSQKLYYYSIATILILFLISWKFNVFTQNNDIKKTSFHFVEVITGKGDHRSISLPDGSFITLNSKSKLTYPSVFNDSIREVTLSGEAFFDIKKNVKKPFIVKTDSLKIKVLGTSFNVKSYPKDNLIQTTLVTGKVKILDNTNNSSLLSPSEQSIFDKSKNNSSINIVDTNDIIAWKTGKMIFNQTRLDQVLRDLSRMYDVDFVIKSKKLLNYRYTGEFDNLSLEDALTFLSLSSSISYKYIDSKIVTIDTKTF